MGQEYYSGLSSAQSQPGITSIMQQLWCAADKPKSGARDLLKKHYKSNVYIACKIKVITRIFLVSSRKDKPFLDTIVGSAFLAISVERIFSFKTLP